MKLLFSSEWHIIHTNQEAVFERTIRSGAQSLGWSRTISPVNKVSIRNNSTLPQADIFEAIDQPISPRESELLRLSRQTQELINQMAEAIQ